MRMIYALCVTGIVLSTVGCMNLAKEYPDVKKFILDVQRPEAKEEYPNVVDVKVDRFDVATLFEGKSFVYRVDEFRYDNDFYNQFALSPSMLFTDAVKNWFSRSPYVGTVYGKRIYSDYKATIAGKIDELYVDIRDKGRPIVVVEIEFYILDDNSYPAKILLKKVYREEVVAESFKAESFVRAYVAAAAAILTDLENDIADKVKNPN